MLSSLHRHTSQGGMGDNRRAMMRRPVIFAAYCCTVSLLCMTSSCSIEPRQGSSRRRLMEACKFGKPELSPEAALLGQERRASTSLLLSTEVTAAQGLANQHSVLLSLLTLGMAAGVDRILLPPHMHRSAFTSTAQWEAGPTEALWDVESIRTHVRKGGIELQESRPADYETVSLECSFAHLALDIADAAYIMKQRTLSALAGLPESQTGYRLHIFLPDIPFSLHTRFSDIYRGNMLSAKFAPQLRRIAHHVSQALSEEHHVGSYNGVHLRLEEDVKGHVDSQGGLQSQQAAYLKAMSKAGFDEGTPVYVASGVFSRNDAVPASEYIAQVVSWVRGKKWRKFASRVFTREELLPEEMTEHLTSEQRAAVDCMTLVDAVRFAALAGSSMSHLVHELRILRGHPQDSSAILGDTNVGLYKWTYSVKSEGGQRDED